MKAVITKPEIGNYFEVDKDNFIFEDYKALQESDSSISRGTIWGDRVGWSIGEKFKKYFKGKVLDIGCGDGRGLELLAKEGFEAEGIDINKEKIKTAQEHRLKAIYGIQEEMPFPDKSFDTIFASHVLEHSYDREKAAKEYQRVGKRAIVIIPLEPSPRKSRSHTSRFREGKELIDLFADKGKIIHKEGMYRIEHEYAIVIDFKT